MQNSKRNLLLFVGLLLLAGLFHIIEHTIHDISALGEPHYAVVTLFFCLELVIYTVLIIFWIQSVHTRLLPSRARNYMVIVALLMIFYLVLRAYKYRIAGEDAGLRLSWYAYYIPMTFIPALFLMVCIRIKKGVAVIHAPKILDRAEPVQDCLRQCRFTCVDMREDPDRDSFVYRLIFHLQHRPKSIFHIFSVLMMFLSISRRHLLVQSSNR